jgi:predicted aconitase with swiveling domain
VFGGCIEVTVRRLSGRGVVRRRGEGHALVTAQPLSFFGGLDPVTGTVIEKGHELGGKRVTGRVLVFPWGKGSTVGSYVIYAMKKKGTAPAAIINIETEPIIAAGCILAGIPLIDKLNEDPLRLIRTGDLVRVLADIDAIEVIKAEPE